MFRATNYKTLENLLFIVFSYFSLIFSLISGKKRKKIPKVTKSATYLVTFNYMEFADRSRFFGFRDRVCQSLTSSFRREDPLVLSCRKTLTRRARSSPSGFLTQTLPSPPLHRHARRAFCAEIESV